MAQQRCLFPHRKSRGSNGQFDFKRHFSPLPILRYHQNKVDISSDPSCNPIIRTWHFQYYPTLLIHLPSGNQTWLAGKSSNWMEGTGSENHWSMGKSPNSMVHFPARHGADDRRVDIPIDIPMFPPRVPAVSQTRDGYTEKLLGPGCHASNMHWAPEIPGMLHVYKKDREDHLFWKLTMYTYIYIYIHV